MPRRIHSKTRSATDQKSEGVLPPLIKIRKRPGYAAQAGRPSTTPAPVQSRRRRWRVKAALALGGAYALAAAWYLWTRLAPQERAVEIATLARLTDQPGQELFPSLSPDTKFMAYSAGGHVFLQRIGEKSPIDLTKDSTSRNWQPAFSPDGRRLAFRSERDGGGIFVMPVTGASVRRLTDFGYNPAWSPDAKEIVCATETFLNPESRVTSGSSLWAVNVSTGERRQVTKPQTIEDAVQPNWSPHGHRIAHWSVQTGHPSIWTVSASGGDPAPVAQDDHLNWNPVWSSDGRYLYFASDRGPEMELWRVRIDEQSGRPLGAPVPVIREPGFGGFISLGSDGRQIAYVQSLRSANLHKIEFDPSREAVVGQPSAITEGTRLVFGPDLSSDGQWFAFFSWGKSEDIFLLGADGKTPRRLYDGKPHRSRWPRWSPDGKRIAFHSDRSGRNQIWTVHPDGSDFRQLTDSTEPVILPVWSPDGRFLAYSSRTRSFIMEVGRPWNEQIPRSLPPWSEPGGRFEAFSWSPDGRKLAGHLQPGPAGTDDTSGIVTYSLPDQTYQRLTNAGSFPAWLSDSRRLLFSHEDKILVADTTSGMFREILSSTPPIVFGLSRDDRLIYFTRISVETDIWLATLK